MNNITVTGRLTKDAEVKYLDSGKQVASFTVVHDTKDRNGEKVGMFYDCSVWGTRGDVVGQYFKKGGTVTVAGRLEPVYVKDGKAYLKLTVNDFTLPPKPKDGDSSESHGSFAERAEKAPVRRPPASNDYADPIPF